MTADELRRAAVALYGERGFVSALARDLRLERTQVWRYLRGRAEVPGPVAAAVECWLREADGEVCRRPS